MIEYNEVRPGTVISMEGEPYVCLTAHVFRKQQRKPVNATKLKNLKTGKVMEYSFAQSEKVEEADLEKKPVTFLFANKGEYWFSPAGDRSKRFQISAELLGDGINFMKPNMEAEAVYFPNDDEELELIGVRLPIKVELKVTEAPPDVRGNTAQGGSKQVTLETGGTMNVPMFVKEGDIIRINTVTGEYTERV